jgi:hypothetical protein
VSGSVKCSLAFNTLFAEGQRRYVESLSAYARQFLEQMEKPDVDSIEGPSPAISIEEKTTSKNPRSGITLWMAAARRPSRTPCRGGPIRGRSSNSCGAIRRGCGVAGRAEPPERC